MRIDNKSSVTTNRRKILQITGSAAVGGVLAGCTSSTASDNDDGSNWPSDNIDMIIPHGAGGGADTYARIVAEHLPKYLPNEVDVVPRNRGEASGIVAANLAYEADPDGHTLFAANTNGPIAGEIIDPQPYDFGEMDWFARSAGTQTVLAVGADTDFYSVEDMREGQPRLANTGVGGTSWVWSVVWGAALDVEIDHLSGFDGSSAGVAAVIRGEADGYILPPATPPVEDGIAEEDLRILMSNTVGEHVASLQPVAEQANMTVEELNGGEPVELLDDYGAGGEIEAALTLQRCLGGPPGHPDEIIEGMSEALYSTLTGSELENWSEESGRPLDPLAHEDTQEQIQSMIEAYSGFADILKAEVEEGS